MKKLLIIFLIAACFQSKAQITLNFPIKQISYSLYVLWNSPSGDGLDYHFMAQVNQKVVAKAALTDTTPIANRIVSIDIPKEVLLKIFSENGQRSENMAAKRNAALRSSLNSQLTTIITNGSAVGATASQIAQMNDANWVVNQINKADSVTEAQAVQMETDGYNKIVK